ncbi:MAG: hypothetical protein ACJATD_000089 [Alloalcanivorax sp.]
MRCAALGLGAAAILFSGLPLSLAALTGLAALAAARRWRPATPRRVDVTPGALRLSLRDGRRVILTPPFRVMLREHWLALHCPRRGWVWVFPDQAGPAALTPLRQVLYLQRR